MEYKATAHEVVDQVICPATFKTAYPWAIQRTRNGKRATHFVSHTWEESVMDFIKALVKLNLIDAAFWICFLALPQTWPSEELGHLLATPFQSPFYVALRDCREMVVVRDSKANLYNRLWCTFELLAAIMLEIDVLVAGEMPPEFISGRGTGSTASCTNPTDRERISAAMFGAKSKDPGLEALVNRAMYRVSHAASGSRVHVTRARGPFWRQKLNAVSQ
mmetsp:Transcript_15487/g.35162  ORF Transcript_15487/g.35162 Transcript_15487/m.35162 type:complete len:219 (+) Transcript_15487:2-658(+)